MSRLHPDPTVAVGDIQKAFIDFMEEKGCQDLCLLLKAPEGRVTWKSAPQEEWLGGHLASLMKKLVKISPVCVFSSRKLKRAICKVNTEWKRCNYSKKHDSDFIDHLDEQVRIACHQLRTLKKDPLSQKRFFKKASVTEAQAVQEVLSLIKWTEEDCKEDGGAKPDGEDVAKLKKGMSLDEPSSPAAIQNPPPIFRRLLKRRTSTESECAANPSSSSKKPPTLAAALQPSSKTGMVPALLQDEQEELSMWLLEKVTPPEKKKKKKPSAKKKAKAKPPAKKNAKTQQKSKEEPEKNAPAALKCSFKHRKTSSAYNKAKADAIKAGLSPNSVKQKARSALRQMAADIDSGLVKEE